MKILLIVSFVAIPSVILSLKLSLRRPSGYVMASLVILLAQCILTSLFAGIVLQSYTANSLLIINGIIAFASIIVALFSRADLAEKARTVSDGFFRAIADIASDPFCVVQLTLVLLFSGWCLFAAYLLGVRSYDSLAYHMTMAAFWVQDGNLNVIPPADYHCMFPFYSEILNSWILLFAGNDTWAELPQLATGIFLLVASYAVSRRSGLGYRASFTAGTLFFFSFPVLYEMTTTVNDLLFVLLALASFYFLLVSRENPKTGMILTSVSCGLMIGTKPFGLHVVPLVFLAYAILLISQRIRDGATSGDRRDGALGIFDTLRRPDFWLPISVFVVVTIAVGGYVYIRNLVMLGSPLYPWGLGVFDVQIFPNFWPVTKATHLQGVAISPGLTALAHGLKEEVGIWYVKQIPLRLGGASGPGIAWPILGLPPLVFALLFCRRRFKADYYIFAALAVLSYCFFMCTHLHTKWDSRYLFFVLLPGFMAFAGLLPFLNKPISIALKTIAVLCMSVHLLLGVAFNVATPIQLMVKDGRMLTKREIQSNWRYPWGFRDFVSYLDANEPGGCSIGVIGNIGVPMYLFFGSELDRKCTIIYDKGFASVLEDQVYDRDGRPSFSLPEDYWENAGRDKWPALLETIDDHQRNGHLDYLFFQRTFFGLSEMLETTGGYEVVAENDWGRLLKNRRE